MKYFFAIISSLTLISCATQKTYWEHPEYGKLDGNSPIVSSDRDSCGVKAYSKGITMDGTLYTDQSKVISKVVEDSLARIRSGSQAEPEYWSEYQALEKESTECFKNKGWTRSK
ncbi:hypothetical protein ACG1BZ_05635 [Microbulbifer sp. CNSA002]|uniref:hypothetical protein n=1 Tax=Microbulbifer sp. CNSA002 TaxID=3373604 RepID=UPI0039B641CC